MKNIEIARLVNAREMAAAFPETFERPSNKELTNLKEGDFVKVCVRGERFWVQLIHVTDNLLLGRVDNFLICTHGINYGSIIPLHRDAIYDIYNERYPIPEGSEDVIVQTESNEKCIV